MFSTKKVYSNSGDYHDLAKKIELFKKETDSCTSYIERKNREIVSIKEENEKLRKELESTDSEISQLEKKTKSLSDGTLDLLSVVCECSIDSDVFKGVDGRRGLMLVRKSIVNLVEEMKSSNERIMYINRLKSNLKQEIKVDRDQIVSFQEKNAEIQNKIMRLKTMLTKSLEAPKNNPTTENILSSSSSNLSESSLNESGKDTSLDSIAVPEAEIASLAEEYQKLVDSLQTFASSAFSAKDLPIDSLPSDINSLTDEQIENYVSSFNEKMDSVYEVLLGRLRTLYLVKNQNSSIRKKIADGKHELCFRTASPKKKCNCKVEMEELKNQENLLREELTSLLAQLTTKNAELDTLTEYQKSLIRF